VGSIAVAMGSTRPFVVQNPVLDRLYIVDRDWLHAIDCEADSLIRSTPMGGISNLFGVLAPDANKLYLASTSAGEESVTVYDCTSDQLVASVRFGRASAPPTIARPVIGCTWRSIRRRSSGR